MSKVISLFGAFGASTALLMQVAAAQAPDAGRIEAEARKEGRLVIYTSSTTPEMEFLSTEFAKKFPEIKLEFVRQTSGVVFNRYLGEVASGVAQVDLLYTASTALYEERPELFLPLTAGNIPNLARKRAVEARNNAAAVTAVTPHMLTYSTRSVSADDIKNHLREWRQLSEPRWQNRIALVDPRSSANAASFINSLRAAYGDDWVKDLAKNNLKIFESGTTAAQQAVAGALQVVIPTNFSQSAALRAQNAPVAVYSPQGPSHAQAQSLAVAKNARHANAALVFINWQLSEEGQLALCALHQVPVTEVKNDKCSSMPANVMLSNDLLPAEEKRKIFDLLGLPK